MGRLVHTIDLYACGTRADGGQELADLEVREIIGGYYRQVGVTWDGGTVLAGTPRS